MKPLALLGPIDVAFAARFYDWIVDDMSSVNTYPPVAISSPGGDVGLMIGMYDLIVENDIPTMALGIIQSAAAVLFLAGHKRSMYPNSMLMFQEPDHATAGAGLTDPVWDLHTKLVAMVIQRTGMELFEAHDLFDGKFISAERCLELGLCDEILNLGGQDGTTDRVSNSEEPNLRDFLPGGAGFEPSSTD